jgi:hypothetical protein
MLTSPQCPKMDAALGELPRLVAKIGQVFEPLRHSAELLFGTLVVPAPLSYRDIEEMLLERGLEVDHSTLNRWVPAYAPLIER